MTNPDRELNNFESKMTGEQVKEKISKIFNSTDFFPGSFLPDEIKGGIYYSYDDYRHHTAWIDSTLVAAKDIQGEKVVVSYLEEFGNFSPVKDYKIIEEGVNKTRVFMEDFIEANKNVDYQNLSDEEIDKTKAMAIAKQKGLNLLSAYDIKSQESIQEDGKALSIIQIIKADIAKIMKNYVKNGGDSMDLNTNIGIRLSLMNDYLEASKKKG